MRTLWFVVPAHGRVDVARVCLRQLRRTCDALTTAGAIRASAIVIATDENLEVARECGFGTIERANRPLGRRWNDGFEMAGLNDVDYVVPCGSDDWIHPSLLDVLPGDNEIRCARLTSVVSENRRHLAVLRIPYEGGDGIRVYPTSMLKACGYRPIEEDRDRAMDTSLLNGVKRANRRAPRFIYHDAHELQIVDWKTRENMNSYAACLVYLEGAERDPWTSLHGLYPTEALREMAELHQLSVA